MFNNEEGNDMLGQRITELRKEKNISQEELAEVLMTSRQAVSKWERGTSEPDINRLKDLAIYFGVSIDYLLGYDLESVSLNGFINRLDEAITNKKYDISLDEVKMMISRNSNNIELYLKAGIYLEHCFAKSKDFVIMDYLIELYKKAITIYQPNSVNLSLNDLHRGIGAIYIFKDQYDLAKKYIEDNKIYNAEDLIAECDLELGHYDASLENISNNFLKAVSLMVNSNITQIRLLLRTNKIQEAYDLSNWSIDFIRSLGKNEEMLLDIIYVLVAIKSICEKYLKLDYSSSVIFLKENREKILKVQSETDDIKFYMGKKETLFTFITNLEETMREEIEGFKNNKELYEGSLELFNEFIKGE